MSRFKTGLCSVSFRENSPEEVVSATAAAGLRFIEWGSDVHAPFNDTERLRHIAELQARYGIACSSYGTYFRIGQSDNDEMYAHISAARLLGTDLLRVWCGVKGSAVTDEEEKQILFGNCRTLARIAESEKVTLGVECHMWTYTDTAETIVELMEAVGSEHFRMYWQPNQYRSFEENIRHIETVKEYVTAVHAFNWDEDKKYPLADAVDTWRDYLSRLSGDHTVLLEFMPDDRIESLSAEAAALRNITGNGDRS